MNVRIDEPNGRDPKKPDLSVGLLVFVGIFLLLGLILLSFSGRSEAAELATVPDSGTQTVSEVASEAKEDENPVVIVQNATVDEEFAINNDTQLYSPSNQRATYSPAYDITTNDSYASILYDVFLNQGNVYDDFIIYRSGNYQYVLIYGSIDSDLTFSDCDVVTFNYVTNSQSGKRYYFTYTSGAGGSFSDGGYNFISNIEADNAQLFHNYYERKELHAARIALYIICVLDLFSLFRFFRGGIKSV